LLHTEMVYLPADGHPSKYSYDDDDIIDDDNISVKLYAEMK